MRCGLLRAIRLHPVINHTVTIPCDSYPFVILELLQNDDGGPRCRVTSEWSELMTCSEPVFSIEYVCSDVAVSGVSIQAKSS